MEIDMQIKVPTVNLIYAIALYIDISLIFFSLVFFKCKIYYEY